MQVTFGFSFCKFQRSGFFSFLGSLDVAMKLHFKMNARRSELVSSTGLDVVHRVHRHKFYYIYVKGGGAPVGVRRYQHFTAVTGYGASLLLGFV